MREYGLVVLICAAVTYLLTPLVRRSAIAVGAMHPVRERDVHVQPIPRLGGLAMYGGLAAGLLVASRLSHLGAIFQGTKVASGLLLAGGLIVILGFIDDRWGIGVIPKLAGQVAAGVILVFSGASVAWVPLPGSVTLILTPDQQTVLTVLVVVITINAVNFIDGLDGLAAGIVGIGAAAFFFYYYTLTKGLGLSSQTGPALASAILAGVCLGFLPYNFYPARIFMGDTGSMLLGLLLAYAPISSLESLDPSTLTSPSAYSGGGAVNRFPEILPLLVPATIMLIPYADLLLAVVRRTRAGQSPFAADKKHLQHRLLAIGHSHRASVLIMYLWAGLFASVVVLLSIMRTKILVLAIVTLVAVLVLLLASMPRLRPWARQAGRRGTRRLAPAVTARPAPAASAAVPGTLGIPGTPGVPRTLGIPGTLGSPGVTVAPGLLAAPTVVPVTPAPEAGPPAPLPRRTSPANRPPLDHPPPDHAQPGPGRSARTRPPASGLPEGSPPSYGIPGAGVPGRGAAGNGVPERGAPVPDPADPPTPDDPRDGEPFWLPR